MEAAIQQVLHNTFGEYVSGLENVNCTSFPLTLNNLKLKEKKIQEEMDEDGGCPFDLSDGNIGSIIIKPGWYGNVEVVATNIVLHMAFNPMKAMRRAMRPEEREEEEVYSPPQQYGARGMYPPQPPPPQMNAPPANIAPRFCRKHDSSEKRVKGEPVMKECLKCHMQLQTSYSDFKYCPPCSELERRCMICGATALTPGNYVPSNQLNSKPQEACGGACGGGERDFGPPPPEPPRGGGAGRSQQASFRNDPPPPGLPPPPPSHTGGGATRDVPAPPPPMGHGRGAGGGPPPPAGGPPPPPMGSGGGGADGGPYGGPQYGGSHYGGPYQQPPSPDRGSAPNQNSWYNRDQQYGQRGCVVPPSPTEYGGRSGNRCGTMSGPPGAPPPPYGGAQRDYSPYGAPMPPQGGAQNYGGVQNYGGAQNYGGPPPQTQAQGNGLFGNINNWSDAQSALTQMLDFRAWGNSCTNDTRLGQPGSSQIDTAPQPYAGRAW